ncbi:amidohydrolase [Cryobacterium tagatosivorans]|uniref:Amidohydrolase n=1 Tax=Cryobacterium tagatosivorans TaxID=1259199 RepID=A0A4R8UBZ1_9MICO|nr:amidohydrolase [Cryobacterium tagatosivorans]TFB46540.1 amidohydrolase [Cryobacterium tagatosivorans]
MTGSTTLLLLNGRLPGSDDVVDIEIADGVIRRVGYTDPGRPATRTVDLGERWVIPGLWDNHVHFSQWAQTARRLDVSAAASAAAAAVSVAGRVPSVPSGDTLVGFGFRDGLWPDAPGLEVLDAASGDVPVVLVSGDLHSCWLNSAALALHGFAGHPTGLLREDDCFAVVASLGAVADAVMDGWADEAARVAASRGVVGIVDLEMTWNLDTWRRRIAAGTDALRVEFGIYSQDLARAVALGLRTGAPVDGTGGLLTVGPYKVITDGSLNTRTAYCFDEYPGLEGTPGAHGMLTVPPAELVSLMRTAAEAGIRPAVHAIGDHANSLALDAFAELACEGSIEHAQLLAAADIGRFARLGVVASVQPEHALDDRDVADRYWAGRTGRAFVLASLLDAGVQLALGSDAPVAPLDPWVTMAAAVGRGTEGREPWHPEQAISRQAALAASARGRHQVAVGEVADLAVCEVDPLTASVADLRRMPVAATLLAGRFTHTTL